jgi:3-isopropylmalate/(R)-2-methylmalate dehydratase small subunit
LTVAKTLFEKIWPQHVIEYRGEAISALEMDARIMIRNMSIEAGPGDEVVQFPIDAFARFCLVEGIDQLGFLRQHLGRIERFEETRPWTP